MKALILAAGIGSRLAPITDEFPKSMVRVNGKEILAKQLDNLIDNGITDITIISGYLGNKMQAFVNDTYPGVKIINNSEYLSTNNMYSAYMAKEDFYGKPFLMMNADVFFDASAINALMDKEDGNYIVTDLGNYLEESMKVISDAGKITGISKAYKEDEIIGTSIDVYRFSAKGGMLFFDISADFIENKKELKLWSEVALHEAMQKEDFYACSLGDGRWVEIDNHDDLALAEKIFK